jgi:hypothetical protein
VIPSPPAGARRAYGPDLRLSLIQARGAPARIDVPLGIDVDRDGPEPTQLGLAMPIFIDAPHVASVRNDHVNRVNPDKREMRGQ